MLVLLVIFMVTAPIIQQGVTVDLPKTRAAALASQEDPLVVGVTKDGTVFLNDNVIALPDLRDKLEAIGREKPDRALLLRADRNVPYGDVVRVIAAIKEAGIQKLGMVTEPAPDAASPGRPAGRR
jgi:biopolymer transport protein TolR